MRTGEREVIFSCRPLADRVTSQVSYFCGYGPECSLSTPASRLERAKSNVQQHYAVVGVLEDLPATLDALAAFVPAYFGRVTTAAANVKAVNVNLARPASLLHLSPEEQSRLQDYFWEEIEFYQFCVNRLKRQEMALNL